GAHAEPTGTSGDRGAAAPAATPSAVAEVTAPGPAYAPASAPGADPTTDSKLRLAVAAGHRTAQSRLRDLSQHPVETLEFFGLRDDMRVIELWPEDGWYTALLAPVLAERGELSLVAPSDAQPDPQLSALL